MDQLKEAYRNGNLLLFVGSGVSANLGLPTWPRLIDELAEQLGYAPEVFKTYGEHLALAEYYKLKTGSIGPLRSWMDREWHKSSIEISESQIHKTISLGNFPIIYTTNYDRWLEFAHSYYKVPYKKIAKVSDLVKLDNTSRQIIKFHGDFDDDQSIVLDETSYFERLKFETPLDIKLKSDILGKSVLFIGYSLSDINLRLLFYSLSKLWESEGKHLAKPESFIFSSKPNPVQELIFKNWGIQMISSDEDEPKVALLNFLQDLIAT